VLGIIYNFLKDTIVDSVKNVLQQERLKRYNFRKALEGVCENALTKRGDALPWI
jgi:hypothetical protein